MRPREKPHFFFIYVFLSVFTIWNILMLARLVFGHNHHIPASKGFDQHGAGNSTLGFEAILALTSEEARTRMPWRTEGMKKAAVYTGLDIQYPVQPVWSDSDVENLKENNGVGSLNSGSARCWLGHLWILRQATKFTSTLILEDDADWDVDIRTQIVQVADAVRNLTMPEEREAEEGKLEEGKERPRPRNSEPYGLNWDVLWLGHCGSSISPNQINFHDPTIPPKTDSWNPTIKWNPAKIRYVHETEDPLCLYAYAVTQQSATKILKKWTHGNTEGIDIWLLNMCRGHKLRCIAISPELFHEHEAAGIRDSAINGQNAEKVLEFEKTTNIWHSARCNSNSASKKRITCPHQYGEMEVEGPTGEE